MPIGIPGKAMRGGSFRPSQIDSLAHWYDATKLSGFSAGSSVGTWPDSQGSDDLTQATGSKQPTYQPNVIGGNPVLRHDGVDDVMARSYTSISEPYHIYIIFQMVSLDGSGVDIFFDAATNRGSQMGQDGGSSAWYLAQTTTTATGGSDDTSPHIGEAIFRTGGTNDEFLTDGVSNISSDLGSGANDGVTTGTRGDKTANYANVDIGEILVCDAELSSSDANRVRTYLSDKWGITI